MSRNPDRDASSHLYSRLKDVPDWDSKNVADLLVHFWQRKGYTVRICPDYWNSYEPQINICGKTITFHVAAVNSEQDLQLAIALINSDIGTYDTLPPMDSDDDSLIAALPKIISEDTAKVAYELLSHLSHRLD